MKTLKIYNTLTKKKEDLITIEPSKVTMYVCGPTVYNFIHIGNARPYVVFDTVRRYLEYSGYEVKYVQNFTDIDDKIINQAISESTTANEISTRYIKEAFVDSDGLNVKRASFHPLVTEEMNSIVDMIISLIDKGYAYSDNGTVYFDTSKYPEYGKLSKKVLDDLNAGARVEVDEHKKNKWDFVLWKPAKEGEPKWESPWGFGRPGWHIECSVMAKKYLGERIDIHAGGEDLIFPHHENEIAQSECANGVPFAKYWMHNGFINIDNEKMSKSKGNFFLLRDIAKEFPYDVIRFFILNAHYRSPVNFSHELMTASGNGLNRIKNALSNLDFLYSNNKSENITVEEKDLLEQSVKFKEQFENAMSDDFNTADAITAIYDFVKFSNINISESSSKYFISEIKTAIINLCDVLGIIYDAGDLAENENESIDSNTIEIMIEQRQNAKKNKDYKEADRIREELNNMGIVLEDMREGVKWKYK